MRSREYWAGLQTALPTMEIQEAGGDETGNTPDKGRM